MNINNIYSGKKVLVTGGTGMIGKELVNRLVEFGAEVRVSSLDDSSRAHPAAEFVKADLTNYDSCVKVCDGMEYVFQLAGIKGSPLVCQTKPASFFDSTILFSLNMLKAARQAGVEKYLSTSSVGVYAPSEVFHEDDVWISFPSKNDWFAGWAKRMGELQVEAYKIQYGWNKIVIVRPANVYGNYDNFSPNDAMVIPSLIRRAVDGENPLVVWGDGSPVRDFIHARDVANGMLLMMDKMPEKPVNLGSGMGVTIRQIAENICKCVFGTTDALVWDTSKPSGDKKRLMDISYAKSFGFMPEVTLEAGISETVNWYKKNRDIAGKRYNVFLEDK